jgi:hypothetical protein
MTQEKNPPEKKPTAPANNGPQSPTDDVVVDTPPTSITIGADGTVDAAGAAAPAAKPESLKDGFTGAAGTLADNLEGGSPGLPKNTVAFLLSFGIVTQIVSLFAGFHTFMTAVKRPNSASLVPAAAAAVTQNWNLLLTHVPGALADINITTVGALLSRLQFVQGLLKSVVILNNRLLAIQSHLEDQLVTALRPLYERGQALFLSHDDLMGPMDPLVQLFAKSGQKAAESRRNNQKVADDAVAAAKAADPPETGTGAASVPGIVVPSGTAVSPGTPATPATPAPVTKPAASPAPKKKNGRVRG